MQEVQCGQWYVEAPVHDGVSGGVVRGKEVIAHCPRV